MFLIDSNILVYSRLPGHEYLREILLDQPVFISEISRVEVLGYHKIISEEEAYFKELFHIIPVIFPTSIIFDAAITIRKKRNIKLGDSIIAATAIVHDLSIYTRNIKDFENLGIDCFNPIV